MQIRVGYELIYDCVQPTPMMLLLNVHHSRVADLVAPDHVTTEPVVPVHGYRDGFGNWCSRIVAPRGRIRIASSAVVNDSGNPDPVVLSARQHAVQDLPDDVDAVTLIAAIAAREAARRVSQRGSGRGPIRGLARGAKGSQKPAAEGGWSGDLRARVLGANVAAGESEGESECGGELEARH